MKGTHCTSMVVGFIGHDLALRYTVQGTAATYLNVAVHYENNGAKPHWIKVHVYGQRAETLHQHARRGSKILAQGPLKTARLDNGRGARLVTFIEAQHIELC